MMETINWNKVTETLISASVISAVTWLVRKILKNASDVNQAFCKIRRQDKALKLLLGRARGKGNGKAVMEIEDCLDELNHGSPAAVPANK